MKIPRSDSQVNEKISINYEHLFTVCLSKYSTSSISEIFFLSIMARWIKNKDGAAAMTSYARMQFTEMSELERDALTRALLRYCELDTMAMVMIMEAWLDWCGESEKLKQVG